MRESRRDSFEVDGDPENDAFLAFSVTFNNSSILEFLDLLQSVFQQLQPVVAFNRTAHGKTVFSVLHLVDTELPRFLQQGGDPVQEIEGLVVSSSKDLLTLISCRRLRIFSLIPEIADSIPDCFPSGKTLWISF